MAAGIARRASPLVQRLGLEWVHRLALEPRRLAGLYLRDDLPFAVRAAGPGEASPGHHRSRMKDEAYSAAEVLGHGVGVRSRTRCAGTEQDRRGAGRPAGHQVGSLSPMMTAAPAQPGTPGPRAEHARTGLTAAARIPACGQWLAASS